MKKLMDTMEESLQATTRVVHPCAGEKVNQDVREQFFSEDTIVPKEDLLPPCQETSNTTNGKSISFFE